jgi:photosynthetic reaction center H subunit
VTNKMLDAIGPATYANRADHPDMTVHGEAKIVPLRVAPAFFINPKDPDPRGMSVKACDGQIAGKITEAWVDRAEPQVRYYEVTLPSGKVVLLPATLVQFPMFGLTKTDYVHVKAITAAQFADVPGIKHPDSITLLEEDKIMAYYAGGFLYATPDREKPIL